MSTNRIGNALYDLLSTQPDLLALHGGRVTPVVFEQASAFPALYYNTKGLRPLGCRGGSATKQGLLEIGAIANNSEEIEGLADTLVEVLNRYDGIHLGYLVSIETNDDDFDEADPEISAFYKRLIFDLTVTKL
ncbi:hypothetical protein [Spirosoma agri]|uniref:DUF3168 domain-containing protein n=1 Tax=Spirosoma agri TaxID=1987381 RepID=A0A6M0IN09_9BACT|nr:hypothetical protein [Spirosoma agri]NEU68313.1 hypothetical protein [Spirosoma agri]